MAEKLDLKKLSRNELVEILRRQEKLLSNKKFLNSLPDKGKKITDMVTKLQQLITEKEQLDATMTRFQQMGISLQHASTTLDSDDDDDDDEEEKECESNGQACPPGLPWSSIHQDKVSTKVLEVSKKVHMSPKDSEMAIEKTQGQKEKPSKVWDYESAVTSPQREWKKTQMLPLEEALKLQQVQQRKYEELQAEHARQRLKEQVQGRASHLTLPKTNTYREQIDTNDDDRNNSGDSDDDEEELVHGEAEAEQSYSDED